MQHTDKLTGLSAEKLRAILNYDPLSGTFRRNGSIAGYLNYGRLVIKINQRAYFAHRLAWLYMTGEWPEHDVDHINLIKNDNRWSNLRAATRSQNCGNQRVRRNNFSGLKGAYRHPTAGWTSHIRVNGKLHGLGSFATAEADHAAYAAKAAELFGDFSRVV